MIEVKTLTEFETEVSSGKVLVDIFRDNCGPCRMLVPQLEAFASNTDVKVIKVNIGNVPELVQKFSLLGAPTLILFVDGVENKRTIGFKKKEELVNFVA